MPWTWTLPPIPPLASWPFKNRFVALHAATVRTVAGEGVLIAGDRRSGKSTTALRVSERLGAHVLCAVPVNRILFLRPGAPASQISRRSRSDTLREPLVHHREAGASIGGAMQTLLHLAARTESWSIEFSKHHGLVDLVCDFIDA